MKIIFFANTDWYLYNFRRSLAIALQELGHQVILLSPPGLYGPRLMAEGLQWRPLKMNRRSLNPFQGLKIVYRLLHLYKKEQPDIVHHFTLKCVLYGSFAALLAKVRGIVNAVAGMGLIFSSDNSKIKILRYLITDLLKLILLDKKVQLILQNPEDRQFFLSLKAAPTENIHLIRSSGVNPSLFKPLDSEKRHNKCISILLASRMIWYKGIGAYVNAAEMIRDNFPSGSVEFLLAGDLDPGNPTSIPQTQLIKWHHKGSVTYLGHVEEMHNLLSRVDIVVLPTIYGEGVPRILVEAASAGLPLIATDLPGCREIVHDGINGFLVKPHNDIELRNAISRMIENETLRRRMGRASREIVLRHFDEKRIIRKTINVYRKAGL